VSAVALGPALTLGDVLAAASGALRGTLSSSATFTSVSIDSRTLERGALFVAIAGAKLDGHDFVAAAAARGAACALVHREVEAPSSLPLVRVADTTRALSDLARRWRRAADLPVVGITGSVGKTTTKDMTAHLLETRGEVLRTEGNLNNQYGLPLTLLRLREQHTAAVVEMGMSAPGEIRALSTLAEPNVAVITRVAPVHLEFFPSVDAIAEAKAEIFEGLRPGGVAVLNGDDPRLVRLGARLRGRVVWFGRNRRFEVSAEDWRGTGFGMRFTLRVPDRAVDVALPLAGPHFVTDFLAAAGAAHALGVSAPAIAEAATSLAPARHRGEVRRLRERVVVLDDCYNSSPLALEAAIVALRLLPARRRVAVLGDMLELGPTGPDLHREAGRSLPGRVDVGVGVGSLAKELVAGAGDSGLDPARRHHFDSATEAADAVPALVQPGDAVLVKASRGMKLEGVVEALVARFGEEGA
jgi:UDP-N-acetylmuramoyl-tripeptide--D-alanyl-D-alanine ligase